MRERSFRRLPSVPLLSVLPEVATVLLLLCGHRRPAEAWTNRGALQRTFGDRMNARRNVLLLRRNEAVAGSFFNPIPEPSGTNSESRSGRTNGDETGPDDVNNSSATSKALQPSTINGIPSEEVGLDLGMTLQAARQKDPITRKPFVGIGPSSLNDVTKPEYDDQGYTLYVDERTGTKARVFEALVNYPCLFTLKIVGANDDTFVHDVLQIVASTCEVVTTTDTDSEAVSVLPSSSIATSANLNSIIEHTIKYNGKWASITVQAPVQSAQMLYQLYENVDRDPRVKFKF